MIGVVVNLTPVQVEEPFRLPWQIWREPEGHPTGPVVPVVHPPGKSFRDLRYAVAGITDSPQWEKRGSVGEVTSSVMLGLGTRDATGGAPAHRLRIQPPRSVYPKAIRADRRSSQNGHLNRPLPPRHSPGCRKTPKAHAPNSPDGRFGRILIAPPDALRYGTDTLGAAEDD